MQVSLIVAAVILCASFLGTVHAEERTPCAEAQTTIEIGECFRKAYDEADAELNAVWKQVMVSLKGADSLPAKELQAWRETLLASQRVWVHFKEKDCEAVGYEWFGGSGASNAVVSCWLDHTTARTKDLKARYIDR